MNAGMITMAYLVASVLFILALGGLSHQESARRGNVYGMIGMGLAIIATLFKPEVVDYGTIIAAMVISRPRRVLNMEMPWVQRKNGPGGPTGAGRPTARHDSP